MKTGLNENGWMKNKWNIVDIYIFVNRGFLVNELMIINSLDVSILK